MDKIKGWLCHTLTGPPDCPRQNIQSPRTIHGRKYGPPGLCMAAITGPPLQHTVPPIVMPAPLNCLLKFNNGLDIQSIYST